MTQMIPVNNNPFAAFDVPKFAKQPDVSANSNYYAEDTLELNNNAGVKSTAAPAQDDNKTSFTDKIKKMNPKFAAAAAAVAALVVGAGVFAIKRKKPDTDTVLKIVDFAQDTAKGGADSLSKTADEAAEPLREALGAAAKKAADEMTDKPAQEAVKIAAEAVTAAVDDVTVKPAAKIIDTVVPDAPQAAEAADKAVQEAAQEVLKTAEGVTAADEIANKAADVTNKAADTVNGAVSDTKKTNADVNLVLAAFGVGLFARAFREIKSTDDAQAIELKKKMLESEPYIKRIEIPYITREAQECYENYKNEFTQALDYLKKPFMIMEQMYISSQKAFSELKEGSYSEFYEGTDIVKREVARGAHGSVTLKNYDKNGELFSVADYSENGTAREISLYQDGKMRARAEYKMSDVNKPYISKLFVYTKGSKQAHTVSYDENSNPKSYLTRNSLGRFTKCFNLNSATGELESVFLPERKGVHSGKCAKKYFYKPDGELDKVVIMPSNDLPLRKYNYEDGVLTGMDLYDKEGDTPLLHVPFDTLN